MLTRATVLADALVLIALLAFVLLFTDRGAFAWTLAGVAFVAVALSSAAVRWRQAR